jgi:tetratricopeptide (TPR) repeat protein
MDSTPTDTPKERQRARFRRFASRENLRKPLKHSEAVLVSGRAGETIGRRASALAGVRATAASKRTKRVTVLSLFAVVLLAADQPIAILLDHNHWKRARALIKSDTAESFSQQARIDWAFYSEAAAIKHAEQAIVLDPTNSDYHFYFAQILCEAAGRANKIRAIGLARRCKQEIDTAVSLKPDNTFALFARMLFLFEAPGIVGGDKSQAFATAAQIERIEPARGNFGRARLAARDKETMPSAETYYLKAIEINPRYYSALVELANLYRTATPPRYDLAEKHGRSAQQVEPDRVGAYIVLAETFAATARFAELDKVLQESEANVPDDFAPHYCSAAILVAQSREPGRAKLYLSKYLSHEPEAREPTHAEAKKLLSRIK